MPAKGKAADTDNTSSSVNKTTGGLNSGSPGNKKTDATPNSGSPGNKMTDATPNSGSPGNKTTARARSSGDPGDKTTAGAQNSGNAVNKTSRNSLGVSSSSRRTLQPRTSSFQLQVGQNLLSADNAKLSGTKKVTGGKKPHVPSKQQRFTTKTSEPAAGKKEKPVYDKAATQKFDEMIDGDLKDLPPLPKSMVRVFLSSTFSDMRAERNMLAIHVYPHLKQFCASNDLDFQVVDMRWGVTEDSQNDHSVEKLCLLEVENCQKTSRGPNFVVLSGDRYGFRPIPTEISMEEFEILKKEAADLKLDYRETLEEWYKLDENAIPPIYLLQPIRSKFTFFADYSPGCDEPRKKDTADWWKTFETLQLLLRQAADSAHKKKKLSTDRKHQYFLSVTECEIQEGILKATDVDAHVLVYRRDLNLLDDSAISDENFSRYFDMLKIGEKQQIDTESKVLREDLIEKKIPAKLNSSAIKSYSVPWKPGGINPKAFPQHKAYLERFCSDFVEDMAKMIEKALVEKQQLIQMSNYYSDYEETIHHLKFCNAKCETFCGQQNVLDAAKAYILDETARKPLVIHAQSGAGKTSIMAMIMKKIPVWLKDGDHIKLIRFLGTTPNMINIYEVLFSILGQLSDSADLIMSPVNYKNMKNLVEFIPRHLRQVANSLKIPVVILLDSVDQLGPFFNAYSMEWLPTTLPPNVKLIISTLPEEAGILSNLRKVLPDRSCYVEVPLLPEATGKEIIEMYLRQHKRKLTESQMRYILSVFKGSPTPLFLKLLLDEARKWNSYSPVGSLVLATTVKEAIDTLFKNLEKKFGYTLVSHALGYITIGLNGLTEFEIEDVLSCDEKVLDEVYKFHDPPVPGIVRIPPVLWTRIHFDIKEYLVERVSYGKRTLNWYHRQFIETAREQYTSGGKDVELHKNLMDIYLQDEGIKRTITLSQRKNLTIENADRQVTPQPFTVQNKRKLSCLPYHLSRAYQLVGAEVAKKSVYCNFKFLCTKIEAFSVKAVKDILADFIEKSNDEEAETLLNFLSMSKDDLRSPVRLAVCLLAYIHPQKSQESLISLRNQAKDFLREKTTPLLIPAFPCLTPRQGSNALTVSVQGYSNIASKTADFLLLSMTVSKDSETPKMGFSAFDSETEEFTPLNLQDKQDNLSAKLAYSGKTTYYVTGTDLVALDNQSGKKKMVSLKDAGLDLNKNQNQVKVVDFSCNTQGSHGIISTDKECLFFSLIEMTSSKVALKYVKPAAVIEMTYCTNSETDSKGVLIGKIVNSEQGDQGPENQSFIATIDQTSTEPLSITQLELHLFTRKASFLCRNEWFLISAFKMCSNETKNENILICCQLFPLTLKHEIQIPIDIKRVFGHPDKLEAIALGTDGKLYVTDILKGKVTATVGISSAISNVDVLWEKSIAMLGSADGKVTVYDIEQQKTLGTFVAHGCEIESITVLENQRCITLGSNGEMKSWSLNVLLESFVTDVQETDHTKSRNEEELLDQTNIVSVEASVVGNEFITCSSDGYVRIWSVEDQRLLRKYNVKMTADVTIVMPSGSLVMLDRTTGKFHILDIESGKSMFPDPPNNVIYFTTNSQDNVYTISKGKDGVHLVIDVLSLKFKKISKTITLQKELTYVNLDAILTEKGRYIVLRAEISEEEYNTIAAFWKKKGAFAPQPHRHKFVAVDLTEGNGGMLLCYRQLSKIPTLGTITRPYQGNVMMITTRRWVVFWDIVTGKCDQKTVRSKEYKKTANGMMYRPEWLGQECEGTTLALEKSNDKEFVALGSEDGYMFIYNTETGLPRRNMKPSTKHSAEVKDVIVTWDIPTGKLDRGRPCRTGMFYRPEWLGEEYYGTTLAMEIAPDGEFLAMGSEDGYMFIYNTDTGWPRGKEKPSSKHTAESAVYLNTTDKAFQKIQPFRNAVILIAISRDSKWVVSTCRNNTLKLWDSASGKEQFTMKLDAVVQKMTFTPDSKHLLLITGSQTTRVLMFQVHAGTGMLTNENDGKGNVQKEATNVSTNVPRARQIFF